MEWQDVVRDWLEREERSQAWLARKAKMDLTYFSLILNDHRKAGTKILRRLEGAMGLPSGTLVGLRSQIPLPMEEARHGNA